MQRERERERERERLNLLRNFVKMQGLHHKAIRQVHELEASHKTINLHLNMM